VRMPPDSSPELVRRLAVANLLANVLIVVTGGGVRLSASGLGCPAWPSCTDASLVNTPEYGLHGVIEFGNRLLTFALAAVALATLVAAVRAPRRRPDVVRLAALLLLGIPLQAVIGGVTVLTDLNPWVVMLHFLASMALVAVATVLVRRTREGDGPPVPLVHPAVRGLAVAVGGVLAVVLYLGTVVTASGPHAGDADARRTGLDPAAMSQLHADAVFLLVGMTVGLVVALRAGGAPRRTVVAAEIVLAVQLAQGVVGFVQYAAALPVLLVALHMLGASLLVIATTDLLMHLRERPPITAPGRGADEEGRVTYAGTAAG
jgi:heme a synthase